MVARHLGHDCREVPSGAIAPDGNTPRVAANSRGVGCHPAGGGVTVFWSGGEFMLWRQTVLHGHHEASGRIRQGATRRVVGLEIANDPPATMKVDQHRKRASAIGSVDTRQHFATSPRNRPLFYCAYRLRLALRAK